jgi:Polysaccharide deacetylase
MKPKFIVTVDTETFRIGGKLLPFATHHYADLPGGSFGVQKIMDLCDQFGVKATFFVDVYMYYSYGEAKVAELCQRIHRSGHDLQLHAHPSWLPVDPSQFICDFPLNRQIEILAEGKELIQKWTGQSPVGFRAGAYGANIDTIRALKSTGFRVDSSYFPLHVNCQLNAHLYNRITNHSFQIEGILEIPVTSYWLWNRSSRRKNSKIDVNACSWTELRTIVPQFARSSVDYVVLFLHSFSFLRWDRNGDNLAPKIGPLKRFEALLRTIREDLAGEFVTIEEAARPSVPSQDGQEEDCAPTVPPLYLVPRVLTRLLECR